jgi:hypothetical protein
MSSVAMESTQPAVSWVFTLFAGANGTEHEAVLLDICLAEALLLYFIVHITVIRVEKRLL